LLQRQLEGTRLNVDVQGASLACQPGRPSPELAIAAAARRGVDLSLHRSVYATDEMLMQADLVVVFDGANLELLAARGLQLKNGAIRLGDLSAAQNPDIADPVDGDAAFFDRTYAAVELACSDLNNLLRTPA
jgi:protein-tyrosine-phosphatase